MSFVNEDMEKWFPIHDEKISIEEYYELEAINEELNKELDEYKEDFEWVISNIINSNTIEELKEKLKGDKKYESYRKNEE